ELGLRIGQRGDSPHREILPHSCQSKIHCRQSGAAKWLCEESRPGLCPNLARYSSEENGLRRELNAFCAQGASRESAPQGWILGLPYCAEQLFSENARSCVSIHECCAASWISQK